ncbi:MULTISPECIES: FeoC-like transcriptional regulator [Prosthecochloris]|uniref:Transcriptional regulator HTH-type FeoC domain-containing protein n=1 Tax=Prosthecochloris vibrioformis TaxID=1098 RepID=A0A5C4RZS8_PROVB|nr:MULTISPECIES: FeoC-like transcriptional regulator [Prosthecochloris]ANT65321.1 FeoC like transcriptional regulator [Prosthecochloris sp. CIB 2401]TNJ36201.1 hypothetical protein FGF68_08135 [Prosthecochloris vibrioformis]
MKEELRQYLVENRTASLAELSRLFGSEQESVRRHLQEWIDAGCVRRKEADPFGKACFGSCSTDGDEVYHWEC